MSSPSGRSSPQLDDGATKQNLSPQRRSLKRENSSKHMNGPLYKQANSNVVLVRRVKRRGETPLRQFTRWFVDNQTGLSFNLFALLFLTHCFFPRARGFTTKFFTLPYYNPHTGKYGLGKDDNYFILSCVTLFTGLRASTMEYLLAPFAKKRGISRRKEIARFSEQAWILIYCSIFLTMGLYIYGTSPYYLNLRELWTDWPNRETGRLMKGYMLAQLAFWLQQVLVINIEERRKDHWQMLTHHFVTITLIFCSYRYGYTRVGNLILVLMDQGDLVLAIAKCLKYLGHTTLCDYAFGAFMADWFVCRHILYCMVCYSVWAHTPQVMPSACFGGKGEDVTGPFEPPTRNSYLLEPFLHSDGLVCYNEKVKWAFLSALLFLQLITIVWFFMIVQVAIRVLKGAGADDSRSDDELDDEDDEDEYVYEEAQPLEEEVGVDAIDLKSWERRTGVKRQSSASGVSLPSHSDRKELLGRIGCEKQVD